MTSYFGRKSLVQPYEPTINGNRYTISFAASVAASGIVNLQLKTGAATCVILDWVVGSTAQPLTAEAIESPTITDGTTAITPYNNNRQSSKMPVTLFYSDPTGISGGTAILREAISGTKGLGGDISEGYAWVLKTNTSYVWQITNVGNQTTQISGHIAFTESILP